MSKSKQLVTLACAFAALLMSTSVLAQKGKPPPAPAAPAPLAVYDANGVNVGRYLGYFGTQPNQKQLWVLLNVNGVSAIAPFGVAWSDTEYKLRWLPVLDYNTYYPNSTCSGPPLITQLGPVEVFAMGARSAITDWDGTIKLYIAADAAPTDQVAYSRRLIQWCYANECTRTSCYSETRTLRTWPLETVIDLDATYPGPLKVR